jgi:amino acid permease
MLLFCCGCAIGYIMAIMDILEQFHLLFVHQSRNYTILVVWVVAMVPLSSLQNVQSLQYASAVGIMAIATLIVAALVHYVQHHPHHHQQQNYFRDWNEELSTTDHLTTDTSTVSILLKLLKHWRRPFNTAASTDGHVNDDDVSIMDFLWPINGWVSILTSGPVVLFAFSCQPNVCSIYDELMVDDVDDNNHYQRLHHRSSDLNGEISSHPTTSKKVQLMQRVTVIAVCICATLYCSISVIALADFGNNVQPNMLSCYSNHQNGTGENGDGGSMLIQIATAAMALAIVMAFPLNIFPARVTLIGLWHNYCQQRRQSNSESILSNHNIDRSISLHGIVPHSALTTALLDDDAETDEQLLVATNLDDRNNDGSLGSSLIISPDDTNDNCHVIDGHENGNSTATTTLTNSSDPPFNRTVHIVSTLILTTSTLVLALLLPNISVVFGLLGGTASSWLGFCVPGLLGIQLCKNECANGQPPRSSLLLTSWTLLVGGIIIGILTTGVTIYNMIVH